MPSGDKACSISPFVSFAHEEYTVSLFCHSVALGRKEGRNEQGMPSRYCLGNSHQLIIWRSLPSEGHCIRAPVHSTWLWHKQPHMCKTHFKSYNCLASATDEWVINFQYLLLLWLRKFHAFCLFPCPLFHSIREKRGQNLFPRQLGGFNLVIILLAWLGHAYHNE